MEGVFYFFSNVNFVLEWRLLSKLRNFVIWSSDRKQSSIYLSHATESINY